MVQVSNRGNNYKPLHQRFSELDNIVFSAFCDSFNSVQWLADYKDNKDDFCGIDVQLTASTKNKVQTYDIEIKSRVTVDNFSVINDCFFEWSKWYNLVHYDNDKKLYVAIYPNCNKIAIWNVCRALLEKSDKEYIEMKRNTCKGSYMQRKQVYKFRISDAKIYDFNLTEYRSKYNALYKEITKEKENKQQ